MQPNTVTNIENQTQLVTLTRELPADFETPASVYLKLATDKPSFLLESVTGGEQIARYSFIGVDLDEAFIIEGRNIHHRHPTDSKTITLKPEDNPLDSIRQYLQQQIPDDIPGLPRFSGGLVGYLGYRPPVPATFIPSSSHIPQVSLT